MKKLKVAFISTMPPDRGNLAEYGSYVVQALGENTKVGQVHVVCNTLRGDAAELPEPQYPKTEIHRVWTLGSSFSLIRAVFATRRLRPDIVHINAGIRTWGKGRVVSMIGAMLPFFMRLAGLRVITTLHTIGETVRLDEMGESIGFFTRWGMKLASWFYLRSNAVTVTLESMRRVLFDSFGATNVVHVSHGTYGERVQEVLPAKPQILAFGFWGAFKDADLLVRAVGKVREHVKDAELVLAGGAHPYFPEIYDALREDHKDNEYVHFTGYVPEVDLHELFTQSAVVVMPYRTNAGASGVLNLVRSYGKPVVISDDAGLLEQMHTEGGEALVFHDDTELVNALVEVLRDEQTQLRMGRANLEVAKRVTIPVQVGKMVAIYEQVITHGAPKAPTADVVAPRNTSYTSHSSESSVVESAHPAA